MGKVFCVSDLHGQYDLFKQIKSFMEEDDICYVLGDCVDRGDKGIAILIDIIQDKRFIMLKGNHEVMMLETLDGMAEGHMDVQQWFMNGGYVTYTEFMMHDNEVRDEIVSFVRRLPIIATYKNIVLSHAGYSFSFEKHMERLDESTLLWDRSHINSRARSKEGKIQIHGHTPTPTMIKGHSGILKYTEDKICIDAGAFFTGTAAVLDLDTFEVHYFSNKD